MKWILGKITRIFFIIIKKLKNDQTIYLVYTMGKVGSTSFYNGIKEAKPHSDVYHVHFLAQDSLDKIKKLDKSFHWNLNNAKNILRQIKKKPNYELKIITLTREPVQRAISDIFQNWKHLYDDIQQVTKEEIKNRLESIDHNYVLNWFDDEFKNFLSFDLYKQNFNSKLGYNSYKEGNINILCIQLEKLDDLPMRAINDFLGFNISVLSENQSSEKRGKETYHEVMADLRLDENKLDALYASKYMRHFYSDDQIRVFKKKWRKQP